MRALLAVALAPVTGVLLAGCAGTGTDTGVAPLDDSEATARKVLDIQGCSPLGSWPGHVWGRTWNADPAKYTVVVYILVGNQWWPKPTFAAPDTTIEANGKWRCSITTGGSDEEATRIFAGLAPKSYSQPPGPLARLPRSLYNHCASWMEWTRKPARNLRTLEFPRNGYEWEVKDSGDELWGPGPNYFSASNWCVWVDGEWRLHLVIANRAGWRCSEIINRSVLKYGTYQWTVQNRVDALDPNVVLGLFTWDDGAPPYYGELDVEFSRWGDPGLATNAQYVVQPWDGADHLYRWLMPQRTLTTHLFRWESGGVVFESHQGDATGPVLRRWSPPGTVTIPVPRRAHARTNLWLYESQPPSVRPHVIVTDFRHTP